MYEKIPNELKELKQWCCFRLVPREGKLTKIPVNAYTGENAKSNDPTTWADFHTAQSSVERLKCDGIGFFFQEPYFGVDIDKVQSEIEAFKNGESDNIVSEFIYSLESYAEYSVSGTGIHIICRGKLPKGGRRKNNVEMYSQGRFFVMTGNIASQYTNIKDCTERIKYLHSRYIGTENVPKEFLTTPVKVDLDAQTILKKALQSRQGSQFATLYNGFWEGLYPSQSEADLAFANMLAFWTGADFTKMDDIFRSSNLYREKWERKTGETTYGKMVLNTAIRDCREVYSPVVDDKYEIRILDQEQPRKKYELDDTGNAERFADDYQDYLRYSYINKGWYFYNGKVWLYDQIGKVKELADKTIQKMKKDFAFCVDDKEEKAFQKHLKATRNNKGKVNMIKESEHLLTITPQEFDSERHLFNVQNGYVNLHYGTLEPHDREKFFTKISLVEYTDKIDYPLWQSFLETVFNQDKELIRYVQKAVGYSLTGSTREQCMFILFGNGRNGKSVFLDIINDILGNYAVNIQPQTLMVKQQTNNANSDIARLKGARLVTTTEPNEGVRFDEGLLKQLTGGDKVTARHLYQSEFEFEPEFKIWMATNHKPIIRGRDDGIWRRMHLIPFTVQIPEDKVDRNLKYKLRQELTAILNWAVEGCLLWQKEGLTKPKAVEQANAEYKSEMDVISAFIDDICDVSRPDVSIAATDLYNAYKQWAKENSQYLMSSTKFGREIGQKFEKVKGRKKNMYVGICIHTDYVFHF